MPKKRYTPEEIIQHLRTVELETSKGLVLVVSEVCARGYGARRVRARSARGAERTVGRSAAGAAVGVAEAESR
jgi:hypothetical protein